MTHDRPAPAALGPEQARPSSARWSARERSRSGRRTPSSRPPARRRPRPVRATPAGLTEREVEVLRLLAQGKTNREIAEALVITEKTAGHHVEHIYAKADVSTRVGAALFAMRHDLVE